MQFGYVELAAGVATLAALFLVLGRARRQSGLPRTMRRLVIVEPNPALAKAHVEVEEHTIRQPGVPQ